MLAARALNMSAVELDEAPDYWRERGLVICFAERWAEATQAELLQAKHRLSQMSRR